MSGKAFAKKLASKIAFNQNKFFGKEEHAFRQICEELDWKLSGTFVSQFLSSIFVICVSPDLIETSTNHIEGSWGRNRAAVKKAFIDAVQNAQEVEYPETLALFKRLFPWILA